MSYYQQKNKSQLSIGQDGNTLTMLLVINLSLFAILAFIKVIYSFSYGNVGASIFNDQIFRWFTLPADLSVYISRPWTILTHMFIHDTNVWTLIGNMLWLWTFGYILQDLAGNKKIVPLYIYGALAGAVMYILVYHLVSPLKDSLHSVQTYGASAGIMAIAIGTTAMSPGYRIFPMLNGGVPLWVITILYVIISLATIQYNKPADYITIIAGAGMGYLFVLALQRGSDWGAWMNNFFDWVNNLFNPDKPKKGTSPKTTLYYNSSVQPYKKSNLITQQRIDEILDKISQKGYNTLSEEEKDMLKRASKEDLL